MRGVGFRLRARVTRRLLLGYLGVTLFVLLALEVPLGVQNQRTERHDLRRRSTHDATALAPIAEDAVQTPSRDAARRASPRSPYDYAQRDRRAGRDRRPARLRRSSTRARASRGTESFASRPEIAAALAGQLPARRAHSADAARRACSTSRCRSPRAARCTARCGSRTRPPPSTRASAATGCCSRRSRRRARGRRARRPRPRPLRHPAAARPRGRGGRGRRRATSTRARPSRTGPPEVRSLAARLQRDRREARAAAPLAGRVRRRRLARAAHAADRAAAAAREPRRAEPGPRRGALHEVERLARPRRRACSRSRAPTPAPTAPARVDAAALVRERVEAWRPLADEHGVALVARASTAPLPVRAGAASGSRRCSTTSSRTRSRPRRDGDDGHRVARTRRRRGSSCTSRDEGPGLTAGAARARVRPLLARRLRSAAAPGSGSRSSGGSSRRTTARSSSREAPGGGIDAVVRLRRCLNLYRTLARMRSPGVCRAAA